MNPEGMPPWVAEVFPGCTHDLTAAREPALAITCRYAKDMPIRAESR